MNAGCPKMRAISATVDPRRPDIGTTSTPARAHASSPRTPSRVKPPRASRRSPPPGPSSVPSRSVYTQRIGIARANYGNLRAVADEVTRTVAGDGYAVSTIHALGDGPGFRKVRGILGVTAFGINAIVLPEGYATG